MSEETRQRVLAIASRLNCKVDKNASNLRLQRSNTLALLIFADPTADDSAINPMFPSPQVDFGYDVSDYESVDPQYGTPADFDRLVAEAGPAPHPRHPGHGAEPHVRPAQVVHRGRSLPQQPEA